MRTEANEVIGLFKSSEKAVQAYEDWIKDKHRDGVIAIALDHVVQYAYEVTPQALEDLRDTILQDSRKYLRGPNRLTERRPLRVLHPLKQLRAQECQHVEAVDCSPPMSFNLAFHILLETREGKLFTYPEFRKACQQAGHLNKYLYEYAVHLQQNVRNSSDRPQYEHFLDSMHWRVGCAYYSFLKELYILGKVREKGVEAKIHPLADTLFRTDIWSYDERNQQGRAICIYLPNDMYVGKEEVGRKSPMRDYLSLPFPSWAPINLEVPTVFGTVDLPSAAIVDRAAEFLTG